MPVGSARYCTLGPERDPFFWKIQKVGKIVETEAGFARELAAKPMISSIEFRGGGAPARCGLKDESAIERLREDDKPRWERGPPARLTRSTRPLFFISGDLCPGWHDPAASLCGLATERILQVPRVDFLSAMLEPRRRLNSGSAQGRGSDFGNP